MMFNMIPEERLPEADLQSTYIRIILQQDYRDIRVPAGILDYSIIPRIATDLDSGIPPENVDITGLVVKNTVEYIRFQTPIFGRRETLFLLEDMYLAQVKGDESAPFKVLEVGAGTGKYAYPFVDPKEFTDCHYFFDDPFRRENRVYISSDADPLFVRISNVVHAKVMEAFPGKIFFRIEDVTHLEQPASEYRIVLSMDMLHHVDDLESAITEMVRVTASSGFIAISDYARDLLPLHYDFDDDCFNCDNIREYIELWRARMIPSYGTTSSLGARDLLSIGSWLASHRLEDICFELQKNGIPDSNIKILHKTGHMFTLVAQKPPRTISLDLICDVEADCI